MEFSYEFYLKKKYAFIRRSILNSYVTLMHTNNKQTKKNGYINQHEDQ